MRAAAIIAALLGATVAAHDHHYPELDNWYRSLQANGVPCCSGHEATPLSDVEWRSHEGHYQVRLDDNWIDVPDKAIVKAPNLAGKTLVWVFNANGHPLVRCFLPGTMG